MISLSVQSKYSIVYFLHIFSSNWNHWKSLSEMTSSCWPLFHKNETDEYSKETHRWKGKEEERRREERRGIERERERERERKRKRSLGNIIIHNLGVTALCSIFQFLFMSLFIFIYYSLHFHPSLESVTNQSNSILIATKLNQKRN